MSQRRPSLWLCTLLAVVLVCEFEGTYGWPYGAEISNFVCFLRPSLNDLMFSPLKEIGPRYTGQPAMVN